MSQFSGSAPSNPEKVHALHAQEQMPKAPRLSRDDMVRVYLPWALGILFALGAVALAFQARASWESHRDWVVPATIPFLVAGGLAFGFLAARLRLKQLAPASVLVTVALLFVFLNILRGQATDGEDGLRDAMSIITGILLGAAVVSVVIAFAWDEYRNPMRAPAPEQ